MKYKWISFLIILIHSLLIILKSTKKTNLKSVSYYKFTNNNDNNDLNKDADKWYLSKVISSKSIDLKWLKKLIILLSLLSLFGLVCLSYYFFHLNHHLIFISINLLSLIIISLFIYYLNSMSVSLNLEKTNVQFRSKVVQFESSLVYLIINLSINLGFLVHLLIIYFEPNLKSHWFMMNMLSLLLSLRLAYIILSRIYNLYLLTKLNLEINKWDLTNTNWIDLVIKSLIIDFYFIKLSLIDFMVIWISLFGLTKLSLRWLSLNEWMEVITKLTHWIISFFITTIHCTTPNLDHFNLIGSTSDQSKEDLDHPSRYLPTITEHLKLAPKEGLVIDTNAPLERFPYPSYLFMDNQYRFGPPTNYRWLFWPYYYSVLTFNIAIWPFSLFNDTICSVINLNLEPLKNNKTYLMEILKGYIHPFSQHTKIVAPKVILAPQNAPINSAYFNLSTDFHSDFKTNARSLSRYFNVSQSKESHLALISPIYPNKDWLFIKDINTLNKDELRTRLMLELPFYPSQSSVLDD